MCANAGFIVVLSSCFMGLVGKAVALFGVPRPWPPQPSNYKPQTRYTVCRRPWCFQYMAWIFLSFESVFPLVFGVHAAARLFSAQFHWYSRFASAILLCFMTKVRFLWTRKLLAFWHFDLDLQIFLKFFQKVLWFEGTLTSTPTPTQHLA